MLQKLAQMLDLGELVRRAVKYLVEGVMVAIAAYTIPKKSLNIDEVALIALTAAATFSIIAHTFRYGSFCQKWCRFSIGANLVGFPRM